ncbi:TPA: hypothetical protein ACQ299_000401 [Klebsiella pneumoniae]
MTSKLTRERLEALAVEDDLYNYPPTQDELNTLARMALAAMDSEPVGYFGRFDPDDEDIIDQCSKNVKGSFPLYRHAQPAPVVNEDLYKLANHIASSKSGLPDEWQDWAEELETDIRRAAMLQAGNSPVIADGLIAAVNRLLDSDGSRGCYSAIRCGEAHDEIERLLAAAPQEVKVE